MERLSDNTIDILNDVNTNRLDYYSEYSPLIDALNKLAEYEDAEEQGLFVQLPCKVGDTVWIHGIPLKSRIYSYRKRNHNLRNI